MKRYFYWFCTINNDLLFISKKHGVILFNHQKPLVKIKYRGLFYYKYTGTSIRISEKTIKNKIERCNVII